MSSDTPAPITEERLRQIIREEVFRVSCRRLTRDEHLDLDAAMPLAGVSREEPAPSPPEMRQH